MKEYSGQAFPKSKQTGSSKKVKTRQEQDKQSKMLLIAVWNLYFKFLGQGKTVCMECSAVLPYNQIQWAHIKKRSTNPSDIHEIDNAMLLCPACHRRQEGTDKDLRPKGFKEWLKEMGF